MIPARGWLVVALASLTLMAVCSHARAGDHIPDAGNMPPGVTCDLVRQKVAEHGRARALAWAIEQGYSWRQIRAARRCLD